jgi:hypothetical protein
MMTGWLSSPEDDLEVGTGLPPGESWMEGLIPRSARAMHLSGPGMPGVVFILISRV